MTASAQKQVPERSPFSARRWAVLGATGAALGAAASISPLIAGGVLVGLVALFVVRRAWPASAMALLMLAALLTRFRAEVGGISVRPEHVAAFLVGGLLAWQFLVGRRPIRLDAAGCFALGWLGANVAASLLHAPYPADSVRHLFRLGLMVLTYLVAINLLRTESDWWTALKLYTVLVVGEMAFGLLARAVYPTGVNLGVQVTIALAEPVPYGTLEEGNMFGSHAAAWLVLFLALMLSYPRRSWRPASLKLSAQVWYLASAGVAALATVLSLSRGAWIALVVGLVFLYVFYSARPRGQITRAGLLVLAVPFLALGAILILESLPMGSALAVRLRTFTSVLTDATFSQRLGDISLAMVDWERHPLLGWGTGAFYQLYGIRNGETAWIANQTVRFFHETGVVGFAFFWGFLASVWLAAIRGARRVQTPQAWAALVGLAIGLLVLQVAYQATDGTWLATMWVHAALLTSGARLLAGRIPAGETGTVPAEGS